MTKGFLLVATIHKKYLTAAQFLADSLKEYTNHSVTLFTEDDWVNDSGNSIFDNVYGGAPHSSRAKLWALNKTPYDITCYLDADIVCQSTNAENVFDLLEDNDIVFGKIETKCAAKVWWKNEMDVPHGGMFVWNDDDTDIMKAIAPQKNMMVLNDEHQTHSVTPISPLSKEFRITIQIWTTKK